MAATGYTNAHMVTELVHEIVSAAAPANAKTLKDLGSSIAMYGSLLLAIESIDRADETTTVLVEGTNDPDAAVPTYETVHNFDAVAADGVIRVDLDTTQMYRGYRATVTHAGTFGATTRVAVACFFLGGRSMKVPVTQV